MARQVVVFVDYQNTYMSARRAFDFNPDDHWEGQVHPRTLGELICKRYADSSAELKEVRIYRGMPSNRKDPKGYAAAQRQLSVWSKTNLVHVTTRLLRYPENFPDELPEEKGVDVALAIDYVMMAVGGEYDIGVIFSGDTDLVPALEQVMAMEKIEASVAAWQPDHGYGSRLRPSGEAIRCHWFDRIGYESMRDSRDYNTKS